MIEVSILVLDALILAWLVFTWFYEGHHKRCKVEVECIHCGDNAEAKCSADRRKS